MRAALLLYFVFINGMSLNAQTICSGDTLKSKIIENKPLRTILAVGINVDYLANNFQSSTAGGLSLLFTSPKFDFNVHSRIDFEKAVDRNYVYSVYQNTRSRQAGFIFTYKFHTTENTLPINLGLFRCNEKSKIAKVKGLKPIQWGADIGFEGGLTQFSFRNNYSLTGIDSGNQTYTMGPYQISTNDYVSSVGTKYLYSFARVGINRTRINRITVEISQVGRRYKRKSRQFYSHLFVLTSGKLDDVYLPADLEYPNYGPFTRLDINSVGFYRLGGCIGMNTMTFRKGGTNSFIVEMGILPGPKVSVMNSAYLNFKFRLNINILERVSKHYDV